MIKKRVLCLILCCVLIGMLIPINSLKNVCAQDTYNEAEVLDAIADDWIATCEETELYATHGIALFSLENVGIKSVLSTENIQETAKFAVELSTKTYKELLKGEEAKEKFEKCTKIIASETSKELINTAASSIEKMISNNEVGKAGTIIDNIVKYGTYTLVINECESAKYYFNAAKSKENLNEKRLLMAQGVKSAIEGCGSISTDVDGLKKNSGMSEQQQRTFLLENAAKLTIALASGGVEILLEGIYQAGKIGINICLTQMPNEFYTFKLDKYIDDISIVDKDRDAFLTLISNKYNKYEYAFNNGSVELTKYNGHLATSEEDKNPQIPRNKYGLVVNKIGSEFLNDDDKVENVEYPESITEIARNSIVGCKKLKKITIPSSVKNIHSIVSNCNNLEEINYNAIEAADFNDPIIRDCASDFTVNINENVKKIPRSFITHCGISKIEYPEGVEEIGNGSLVECPKLKKVTIPSSVKNIHQVIQNCNNLQQVNYNAVNANEFYDSIIANCSSNFYVKIGDNVEKIPQRFIVDCGIEKIEFPEKLKSLRVNWSKNLSCLQEVIINNINCNLEDNEDLFPNQAKIYGYIGSSAEKYAKKYNRIFSALDCNFIVNTPSNYIYDGKSHKWDPEVSDKSGKLLEKDKDYTVAYDTLDLKNAGTIKVIIKGKGNYAGEKEINYHIKQRKVTLLSASDEKSYDGQPLTNGNIKESGDGFAEGEGATYTVTGSQTEVGTSKNTFGYKLNANTNADNYAITTAEGTLTVTEKKHTHTYKEVITKATPSKNGSKITKCTECGDIQKKEVIAYPKKATCATEYVYDGKTKKPEVTVTDANGKKVSKSEYALSYTGNCKNVGTYTVKITFKNNYAGTLKKTFTVVPKGTNLKSVKSGKKQMAVQWSKQNIQTTGYQLQYAADKSFKKNLKAVTIKNNKVTSRKISKLVGKKKYYVKIRTYKKVAGKTYYSKWSTVKSVTTKK